jgi:hypothetical protein
MKTKTIKKIVLYSLSSVLFLAVVLAVHIWWVYRLKAPNAYSKVMARIDIKQPVSQDEASKITVWMYHQKGIDHVLVNPQNRIVIFTFFPVKTNGNEVVKNFRARFNLKANRFMPSQSDLAGSCPVAGSSFTYKVYKFIANTL